MDPVTILGIVQTLRRGSKAKGVLGMFGLKNLLALVGLVVVAFAGAGWYLGWYSFATQDDANGQHHIKIQVNASQVTSDLSKGKDKVIMILDREKGAITQAPAQAQPGAQQPKAQPPTQAYSIPLVPRAAAEVHVPQAPEPPFPQGPALPPPPPPSQPVDSWILPR